MCMCAYGQVYGQRQKMKSNKYNLQHWWRTRLYFIWLCRWPLKTHSIENRIFLLFGESPLTEYRNNPLGALVSLYRLTAESFFFLTLRDIWRSLLVFKYVFLTAEVIVTNYFQLTINMELKTCKCEILVKSMLALRGEKHCNVRKHKQIE